MNNNEKYTDMEKVIVRTIAFFDLFDFPITSWEIWNLGIWENKNIKLTEIIESLEKLISQRSIEKEECYYFLKGRKQSVDIRKNRYNYYQRKIKRLKIVTKIFFLLPWIKFIALGNNIGPNNLKDGSDIDVFVISSEKRIWLSRLYCAGLMKLAGMRPKQGDERDKICLNFYLDETKMDLNKFALNKNEFDIYLMYWLAFLRPIEDRDRIYEKLIYSNDWLVNYLSNWQPYSSVISKKKLNLVNLMPSKFIDILEMWSRKWQEKRLPRVLQEIKNKDTRVVVNDSVLKLHSKDRREDYYNKWKEKIKLLNVE